ncbi:MAG: type II toxin-antitoxin system RelE/ParE family toxin [Chthoniobacter sp.]|uniref:type II toxin-antitoxin system RelE/ParE family toxin n=1 Tax=Chthoniobacter sp. TaxID=2510640 RepID=UPI0032A9E641
MSFRVILRPEAEVDIADAADWYESQQSGLGGEFVAAVSQAIDGLSANPLLVSRRHRQRNIRWVRPTRFPYRIVYEVADGIVLVICVLHFACDEHHWRKRLADQ